MEHSTLVFFLCFICCWDIVLAFEFSKDGSIQQLQFVQQAVLNNDNEASLVAIKCQSSTIVLDICKSKQATSSLSTNGLSSSNIYENKHLRAYFVGKKSDCQQGRYHCSELDSQSHTNNGITLVASGLALRLADEAQRGSMSERDSRTLAYNTLILNTDKTARVGFGDVYKVDVSGNFFKCEGVCIGARSQQISTWLGARGTLLRSQRLNTVVNSADSISTGVDDTDTNSINTNANSITISSTSSDVSTLFNVSASCLLDNFSIDTITAGNISVSITVLCDSPGGEKLLLGPHTVPVEVLQQLTENRNVHSTQSVHSISTGVATEEAVPMQAERTALHCWWDSLYIGVGSSTTIGSTNDSSTSCGNGDDNVAPVWIRRS